jgi:hypothetical protein
MSNQNNQSRRQFLINGSLASLGVLWASQAAVSSTLFAGKPNSKFGGVQIGAITYSFRSMPGSVDDLIKYCVECNISAIELMGDAPEEYAGKPKNTMARPNYVPGQPRQQMTDEQRAAMAKYNKDVADWRSSVSMDKFVEVRKMFNNAKKKIVVLILLSSKMRGLFFL